MTITIYQAKAGDGIKKTGVKRTDSFFNTPQEAIVEALALKKRMDTQYNNEIEWDYNGKVTGSYKKMNFLRGYLRGDKHTNPFYLQIVSLDSKEKATEHSFSKDEKLQPKEKKVFNKVLQLFKSTIK
ncbi:hypothetical protein N0O92_15260 [Alkalihalobacillus sp. MEB130]|uniref:hypothetical protein n=1 Tax=Alkalihalobacillus sp. MEB130 TaxID=2976704 RepID=UPI0028DDDA7B|nr:hypothetical protein [Alkalihalobacillus sp. MEB130]MDT8861575.1 hypothetical protein [Alkalihalobacillus sp. MEB130]